MKTVVAAEVRVDGMDKAGQSVGSFRKQLKEAQQDVINMADKFGITSKEAANAAKKVAALKDRIGDAKAMADTFNPDKKFVALGGAVQGVVAGFSAFSGSMGLLGVESKETEALLLKVQSAMALQQGISGIAGAIDSFKLLAASILQSSIFQKLNTAATVVATAVQRMFGASVIGTGTAFNVLKGAIIATGIGALVVIIGTLISVMNQAGESTKTAADEMQDLADATAAVNKAASEVTDILERTEKVRVKNAKIAGATEAELTRITKEEAQKRIDYRNREIDNGIASGISLTELYKANLKDQQIIEDAGLDYQLKIADKRRADDKKTLEDRKKALADYVKWKAEFDAQLRAVRDNVNDAPPEDDGEKERQRLIDNHNKMLATKQQLAELDALNDPESIERKVAKINADLAIELSTLAEGDLQRQIAAKKAADAIEGIHKDHAAAVILIEKKKEDSKNELLQRSSELLSTYANIVGKQTIAGKILAIASATIDTYQAAAKALKADYSVFGPAAFIARAASVAATIAIGIKNVKAIASVKVPGSSGGSVPSVSSGTVSAPLMPQLQTTTLNQNQVNQIGNAAARAYVLETDVSTNSERVRRFNRQARIN